jgi:uncharacterized membrane protein YecN with MAPEG domain
MAPSEQVINLGGPMATRRASLLSGTAGIVAGLLLWRLTSAVIPIGAEATSMALRLGLAAAAMLPCVAMLAAMILAQMGARFMLGAFDPTDGDEARFLRTNQRVISNSVEQLMIFAPALLALAGGAPHAAMPGVLALAVVFAFARLAFWAGYLAAPLARAPGMAATIAVNLATLLAAAWFWLH